VTAEPPFDPWPSSPSFPDFEPTAAGLIRSQAARHGDTPLVVLDERRLSYAEVEEQSAELARGLLAVGVGKGSRVGLLAPNSPDWIIGWLAATRIGAVAVLLNTYLKTRELDWVLRHSDIATLLTVDRHLGHDYLARIEEIAPTLADHRGDGPLLVPPLPFLRSVHVWGETDRPWARSIDELRTGAGAVGREMLAAAEAEVVPADPMVVVYSSGSTAEPKAALHSQGAVVRHAHNLWQFRDLVAGDVIYTPMPLFWIGGLSFTLVAALHAGATLVFEERFDPGATLDLLERERVTIAIGWPHMSKALTEHPSFPERDLAVKGGSFDALLPEDQRPADPSLRVNSLGMTETCGPHLLGVMGCELPESKRGSFGRSAPGLEHKVVDPVTGDELPPGRLGELWVRGYSVMLGLHRHERGEVFTVDGWYPTGDGGWFDEDGHFFFKGRLGEQIKTSGMNVTPREVELVIEEMDEVMHAIVLGIPHPEREQDVAAAVVLRPGRHLEAGEVSARVKAELSSYKVPRHVATFADQDELPWLDSGKIDRRGVQTLLEARFPS
jgi:acyl-coenzyme A synthetase/AMP-(fatty) acid ligase